MSLQAVIMCPGNPNTYYLIGLWALVAKQAVIRHTHICNKCSFIICYFILETHIISLKYQLTKQEW